MTQGQLWNAGPVAIRPASHKRGAPPVVSTCAEPGCTNLRRIVQGARYCDEHARSRDYVLSGEARGPTELRVCRCGNSFPHRRRITSGVAEAWYEFCQDCRRVTPLTLEQLQRHSVPATLARAWISRGSDLPCGVCGRRLSRQPGPAKVAIDHNHKCCKGDRSCGACVRGVLCAAHNTAVGYFETIQDAGLVDALMQYIADGIPVSTHNDPTFLSP